MSKILIVEDMYFWVIVLKNKLKELGVETDWVKNGELAVDKIKKSGEDYEAIIMDVEMPLMNGLEATRQIRNLGYTKPIIGHSSKNGQEDINKGLDAGMNAYVDKNSNLETLIKVLYEQNILKREV